MSAEILRRAASLMRERAEAATEGPWLLDSIENGEHGIFLPNGRSPEHERLGCGGSQIAGWMTGFNAEHIASWHPAVALAVADWLEAVAIRADDLADTIGSPTVAASVVKSQVFSYRNALTVARAYLGADA